MAALRFLALAKKLQSCGYPLLVQHVGSVLCDIGGMSRACAASSALVPKIGSFIKGYGNQATLSVLLCMLGMTSKSPKL